CQQYNTLPFTV
nr:immunoglobulin light chain junction region [Macaca mulatta]